MVKHEMVATFVQNLLVKITGDQSMAADSDGDWQFDFRTSKVFVRVLSGNDPYVLVFAGAAVDVEKKPELFEFLNEINAQLHLARCYWEAGTVFIEMETLGSTIDHEELEALLTTIGNAADFFGPKVVEQFGGKTPHEPQDDDADETGDEATSGTPNGGYL